MRLAAYRALLPDRERVLGADHPDTLTTRHQIAYELGEPGITGCPGRIPGAAARLERVLGADHPDTLTTRQQFADGWRAGDHAGAQAEYRALLPARSRSRAPTTRTR